jgi:hypothetical protein
MAKWCGSEPPTSSRGRLISPPLPSSIHVKPGKNASNFLQKRAKNPLKMPISATLLALELTFSPQNLRLQTVSQRNLSVPLRSFSRADFRRRNISAIDPSKTAKFLRPKNDATIDPCPLSCIGAIVEPWLAQ